VRVWGGGLHILTLGTIALGGEPGMTQHPMLTQFSMEYCLLDFHVL
jgi:hypothetical protein